MAAGKHVHVYDDDITVRIRKATQQVGGLMNFFLNKDVDHFTKKLIFLAYPVNTVLHGCESWALKAQHINKLQVFFHRSIRRILGINMHRVEHDHIKNEHIRNFFGVADIIDEIRLRQFHWLGKLGRQPDSLPTKRLLSAWAPAARRGGAQFIKLRKTYGDTLESILGEDCMKSGSGNLKEWLSLAQSPAKWKHLEFIFKKDPERDPNGFGTRRAGRASKSLDLQLPPPPLLIDCRSIFLHVFASFGFLGFSGSLFILPCARCARCPSCTRVRTASIARRKHSPC